MTQWGYTANALTEKCQSGDPNEGYFKSTLLDLTGDGRADLVVTRDECTDDEVGNSIWLVYENTGSAFSDSATEWGLPPESQKYTELWRDVYAAQAEKCQSGDPVEGYFRSTLLDLTGDGKPDLVVTRDECTDDEIGNSYWLVYENTGAEFSDSATEWSLPPESQKYTEQWQDLSTAQTEKCQSGDPTEGFFRSTLLDLSGDGRPDIVVTRDECTSDEIGNSIWMVYENEGDGFSSTPIPWGLPPESQKYVETWQDVSSAQTEKCQSGEPNEGYFRATLLDLTGDGAADIVVTRDECSDDEVGNSIWYVYENNGTGFSESPTEWALPPEPQKYVETWQDLYYGGTEKCADGDPNEGYVYATTFDLTADGLPDVVVTTDECTDEEAGNSRWLVFENTGSGFESSSLKFPLPPETVKYELQWGLPSNAMTAKCQSGEPNEGYFWSTLLDLNGDGALDMVLTQDECTDEDIGSTWWEVFLADCD